MKNFVADGDSIVATAPYAVTPGLGMLIGSLFCVATKTAAMGVATDAVTEGQFDLTAVSAETATPGAVAFWDDTNRRVSVSTGTPIGTLPYGKSAGVAVARVRLQSTAGAAPVSGAGTGNRLIIDGDSRGAQNNADGASATNGVYNNTQGAFAWANALLGQRLNLVANLAVGGSQMSGHATANLNVLTRLPNLASYTFDWVLFCCDLNDIAADRTAAAICADYEAYWAAIAARGAKVIHIAPYAPSVALSAARSQVLLQVRDYILRAPQRLPHVFTVDAFELLCNPTASPPTANSQYILDPGGSGFHFNGAAASGKLGPAIAAILADRVPALPTLVSSAADTYGTDSTTARPNLIDNPLMTGTGGTKGTGASDAPAWVTATVYAAGAMVLNASKAYCTAAGGTSGATAPTHTSGTVSDGTVLWTYVGSGAAAGVADGYTLARTAGAGTAWVATVDRADGIGKDQVIAVTGAGATDIFQLSVTGGLAARGVNGATYVSEAEVGILGASGLNAPTLRTLTTVAGASVQSRDLSASTTLQDSLVPDCTVRLRVPAITLPATGSVTTLSPQFFPTFGAASARAVLRIGRFSFRRTA